LDNAYFANFFDNAGEQLFSPVITGNHHVTIRPFGFDMLQF
jgi:hypothetical protein